VGTASLVIGLGLIIIGFVNIWYTGTTTIDLAVYTLEIIISIILIIVGGFLLRKYDKDKKKEEKEKLD